ncbi:MAG TPA: HAMP domain-containing sensor histidine kinase [Candidatus Obscuribacterales bacterium]
MRFAPKTIYAKGLILICVPLLVEFACGMSVFSLQRYYEEKLAKERVAVEIIFHANEMWIDCTEIMFLKGYFNLFGGPELAFAERMTRIKDEYALLKKLVANDASQTKSLELIHFYTQQALELSNKLEPVVSAQRPGSSKMKALLADLDILAQAQHLVGRMASEIEFFREPEFLHSPSAVPEVEKSTALVDRAVFGSLAASTLVAILLFVYFIRSINQGVQTVVDNTERFKQGLELAPQTRGGDELAHVDAAFHEMADEIKEAQQTKQAIVSMISHDLRSPLTSVMGYLSNLREGAFGDASQDTLSGAARCERELERLIRLISDLLDLDKIEAGKFELRPRVIPVQQVIEGALSRVRESAEEKGIAVRSTGSTFDIYADPDRITQALANLLSTALRLSPAGSSVETRASRLDGHAEITIASSASTISQATLESLFDRYRLSDSELRLELPVSKEIVRLHGGMIDAAVEPELGLQFSVRLPSHAPPAS